MILFQVSAFSSSSMWFERLQLKVSPRKDGWRKAMPFRDREHERVTEDVLILRTSLSLSVFTWQNKWCCSGPVFSCLSIRRIIRHSLQATKGDVTQEVYNDFSCHSFTPFSSLVSEGLLSLLCSIITSILKAFIRHETIYNHKYSRHVTESVRKRAVHSSQEPR